MLRSIRPTRASARASDRPIAPSAAATIARVGRLNFALRSDRPDATVPVRFLTGRDHGRLADSRLTRLRPCAMGYESRPLRLPADPDASRNAGEEGVSC